MSAVPRLRIGVRDLARFALRRGDLERAPAGPDAHAGSRAHRRLQQDSGFEAEVALSRTVSLAGGTVTVSGRIDLRDAAGQRLIEIKSTLVPLERLMPGRRALDRSQLELYAWLQAARPQPGDRPGDECGDAYRNERSDEAKVPPFITVLELQYVNLRTDTVQSERWSVELPRIEAEVAGALERWLDFQQALRRRAERRHRSLDGLAFPFGGFRPGQRDLAAGVYRSIGSRAALLLEAPTGTGKTLGVLYPAVRSLHRGGAQRLIWLTAKTSGRDAVFDALHQLGASGLHIDALLVRSRRDGCFCERDPALRDDAGQCAFAQGFHDRLPGARRAAMDAGSATVLLDGAAIDALAGEHRLCPHALTQELLPWAAVVVCDYNHLFDPVSALPALSERIESSVVLIDEAHNLPDRARQMSCASLSRLTVLGARTATQSSRPDLSRALQRVCSAMQTLSRRAMSGTASAATSTGDRAGAPADASADASRGIAPGVDIDPPVALIRAVRGALDALAALGASEPVLPIDLLHALHRFSVVGERFEQEHRCLVQRRQVGRRVECVVELVCLDARRHLGRVLVPAYATVAFSAVLGPMAEFRDALGLPAASTVGIRGESPFRPEQLSCQLIDWIPVRYAQRDASRPALVSLIAATVDAHDGHYLVFLPSYAWLVQLAEALIRSRPDLEVWQQSRDGTGPALSERLARLDRVGTTVGFAITGGVYGEGIDYVGDRLIGAIVIGTALPGRDALAELMIEHHAARARAGYDIVCRYPALVRVLQSGGRVIRTPRDRGVLLLVDQRFDDAFQRRFRPAHWHVQRPADAESLRAAVEHFWCDDSDDRPASPAKAADSD